MKSSLVVCVVVCIFVISIPTLGAELEEENHYARFITEFGLAEAVAYQGLSTTVSKSAIGSQAVERKNPYIACGLSVLVPGLGQFYNGQPVKGSIQLGLVVGGYTMFFLALEDDLVYADGTVLDVDDDDAIGGLGLLVAGGAVLWSIIDAPISANNINMRNQMQAMQATQAYLHRNNGYSVSPLVNENKLGAKYTLLF